MSMSINTPDRGAFSTLLGFQLTEWSEGHVRMEMEIGPDHLNRSGVLHGGVLSALLDTACGYAGTFCANKGNVRWALTLELNTKFTGQATSGTITAVGRKRSGGRNIFFSSAEIFNADGDLIAFGDSVQKYRSGCGDPDGIPNVPHS